MAGAKTHNHDYHLVPTSPWPIIGAFSALATALGAVAWMHKASFGPWVFGLGFAALLAVFLFWWMDVVHEANTGDHTPVVQLHHRYGMILFIASEVMFFVAWFWAYFSSSLYPSHAAAVAGTWPPKGIEVLDPFAFPLLNTLILLLSGTTVTWAHHALIHGDRDGLKKGLWATIGLGLLFSTVQAFEYSHAGFGFAGNIYGATFYMATGFHGFHVAVGTIFLAVCLVRVYRGDFSATHHFGFEAAAWYWHFVDVVWLFLFISVYLWGSHFGTAVAAAGG